MRYRIYYARLILLSAVLVGWGGHATAAGLGALRGDAVLGSLPRFEIDLLGHTGRLDASCVSLVAPENGDDLPLLKQASFAIRAGKPSVLEIRGREPLREPIVQMVIRVGCGVDVEKIYTLLVEPPLGSALARAEGREAPSGNVLAPTPPAKTRPGRGASSARNKNGKPTIPRPAPAPPQALPASEIDLSPASRGAEPREDRLVLSGGEGELTLQLAADLAVIEHLGRSVDETEREILRLEYRLLQALHDQGASHLEMADRLRNIELALTDLQGQLAGVAKDVSPAGEAKSAAPAVPPAPVAPPTELAVPAGERVAPWRSQWVWYGLLIGVLAGIGGWLGWRHFQPRRPEEAPPVPQDPLFEEMDPRREGEREDLGGVDLPVEPSEMGAPMQVDLELDAGEQVAVSPPSSPARPGDSLLSVGATTVDEHFEVNPVMELAEIMLSFGRVKGAAQALQEYIDGNPQEALQPWIRLMEVYRLGGQREEFERVARNLNQHFNVQVQTWEEANQAVEEPAPGETPAIAPVARSVEEMPRIIQQVVAMWESDEVVAYLHQLLRDNRGGQRQGFPLPVVEEILFLIDLREAIARQGGGG